MSSRTRRLVVGSFACLVVAVLAATVWAYWTDAGVGNASAVAGTFDAPVMAAPAVDDGTVTLSWTSSVGPGPGVVDYAVERRAVDTEPWTAVCGTATAHTTSTTCSEVPGAGTWEWHVVAYFRTWTATSDASDAIDVADPDTVAPTGEVTAPAAASAVRATIVVSSDSADADSGVASVRFERSAHDAGVWTPIGAPDTTAPYAVSWVTTTVTDGLYDLRALTTDGAGNAYISQLVTSVRVDNTAPSVALTLAPSPVGAFLSAGRVNFRSNAVGSFGLVASVSDAGSGPVSASFPVVSTAGWTHAVESVSSPVGGPFASSGFSWSSGASVPGTYTVTVADAAGNTATSAVTFAVDVTVPTGAVTAPAAAANVRGGAVSVTSSSADAGAGVGSAQFQLSPAGAGSWSNLGAADSVSPYATSWDTTGFADGVYDLRVVTTDNVGNAFTSATIAGVRVDNTAPTGTITAPTTNAFVSGSSVAVAATAADTGGGVSSVQFQTSPRDANTWTNLGAVDTTSPYGVTWNTTSGYPDGPYDLRAVVTDKAGNTFTASVVPVEVQNVAPSVTALQLVDGGGTPGRPEAGDRVVVTYSQVLGVTTLCSTWSGNLTVQTLNDVTVTLVDGGGAGDSLTVTSPTCTLHFGSLGLGATGYVTGGNRTFAGSGASASSVVWDPSGRTLSLTLGAPSGPGTVGTVAASTATYGPDPAVRSAAGAAVTGSFATGAIPQF